ncbi:hypothetical protein E05_07110 [Plautia stali symbiont]|nr:hypothetical protein E05_07110 [Plautia stali symbiont]
MIGADGAWSRVRRYLTPVRPVYTGITFFEGWIDHPSDQINGIAGNGTAFSFGGAQALVTQRNGGGRICVYAAMKRAPDVIDQHIASSRPHRLGARQLPRLGRFPAIGGERHW